MSVSFELYEDSKGRVYEYQLQVSVIVTNFLTELFQIQRQCPPAVDNRVITRALRGARDLVGVFGHCHAYAGKPDDPGLSYFKYLEEAGYEVFNFNADQDKQVWKSRQEKLGVEKDDMDGVPGPMTIDALQDAGYTLGIWLPAEKHLG